MSAVLRKLDEIAQRAASNHGLNIVEPVSAIYGTGSFFKGVAACEPGLVIDCAKTPSSRRRSLAFLSLCNAGWDEYRQRYIDAEAAAEKAWKERASAHLALHPEDGIKNAWFGADWDESKNWLRCKFDDPEYNRAAAATNPPKTMEEPCVWAVREWCARAGTASPLVVKEWNYYGPSQKKTFDHDLRELFAPLDDEAIAEVLKGWASKLTWDQLRNRAPPRGEEIMKHVLLKGVGRFKHFEIRDKTVAEQSSSSPPADSVLIWSSDEPGTMPSVRLTSVYPGGVGSSQRKRPAAGSSVGDASLAAGAAPHSKAARTRPPATPAELHELGHAAWLIAHARRWEAIAQACVRALLTPAHPLHAEMLKHGSTPDPLQCVEWRASVEQSPAMRAVCEESLRGWPQEAKFEHGIQSVGRVAFLPSDELRRMPGRTEPFGSQTSYWALRQHCGFRQAGQRAHEGLKADRLHELKVSPPSDAEDAMQLDRRATLLSEPPEAALLAIGALQTQGLKELKAELKRVHASVDGMAGLAEHMLALHEGDGSGSFQIDRFRKAIQGHPPPYPTEHPTEDGTPPYPMRVAMQAGPVCGTLFTGSPLLPDRLHIALPEKHCLGRYLQLSSIQLRDAILGSGSPPMEPAERLHILCPFSADDLAVPHLEELVPGVPARLRTPVDVQRMVNECVLSLYVSRIGLRAATSIQLRKAAEVLHLPASVATAFQWLADPQGVGIRAWRWERRRIFFLLRARGHTLLSALPSDLFQKITMLADDD